MLHILGEVALVVGGLCVIGLAWATLVLSMLLALILPTPKEPYYYD